MGGSEFSGVAPPVGVVMGSSSDAPVMREAVEVLSELGVDTEFRVISAHRSPERMVDYARSAVDRGLSVVIAGAGGAAHLPGMIASLTTLPVIGVPVPTRHLGGNDSLLSIAQMPGGVPVATMAIGGARNAGLLAARILGLSDEALASRLEDFRLGLVDYSRAQDRDLDR
ncbi:MAG: 5-(carboxyamino)imidazole ribonucleotide mutase [Microthrixaceae bacterium]|nr:5-(carboxyamino)imidazole ribonucleotide mutase [Microthrixaceae bacterium]